MTSFEDRFTQSYDGTRIHYRYYEAAKPSAHTILCLPGLMRNVKDFEDLAPQFVDLANVITMSFRGRGQSGYASDPMTYQPPFYVKDAKAVLDDAGVAEAIFFGTSLGGLVTMMSGLMMRDRVKAAVINDIGPTIEPKGLELIQKSVGIGGPVKDWDGAVEITKERNAHVFPNYSDADWLAMAKRLWREDDDQIRLDYDFQIKVPFDRNGPVAGVDLWPLFRALGPLPLAAVWGETSTLLSSEVFEGMQKEVPTMVPIIAKGVGHAPYLTEPDVLPALRSFVESVPAKTGGLMRFGKRLKGQWIAAKIARQMKKALAASKAN